MFAAKAYEDGNSLEDNFNPEHIHEILTLEEPNPMDLKRVLYFFTIGEYTNTVLAAHDVGLILYDNPVVVEAKREIKIKQNIVYSQVDGDPLITTAAIQGHSYIVHMMLLLLDEDKENILPLTLIEVISSIELTRVISKGHYENLLIQLFTIIGMLVQKCYSLNVNLGEIDISSGLIGNLKVPIDVIRKNPDFDKLTLLKQACTLPKDYHENNITLKDWLKVIQKQHKQQCCNIACIFKCCSKNNQNPRQVIPDYRSP